MSKLKKTFYFLAWGCLFVWIVRPWMFSWLKIGFLDPSLEEIYRSIWVILIPLCLSILIIGKKDLGKLSNAKSALIAISVISSFCFIICINFLLSFCTQNFSKPLYINKNRTKEIRKVDLNCGAWDSDMSIEMVETRVFLRVFIWYSVINEGEIDYSNWTKTSFSELE